MIGIYKIINKINNKVYIGQSIDIDRRLKDHISGLNGNYGHNPHFQNAWNKYGEKNFEFEIVEEVEDTNLLDEREIYYISKYDSNNPDKGYNMMPGGNLWDDRYKMYVREQRFKSNKNLKEEDVRRIKLFMFCGMDRKEISEIYNVSTKVLTGISMGKAYPYVCPELNESIHNLKQKMTDERNKEILKLFDSGLRIVDIMKKLELSESIVSKCIHKYRKVTNKNYNEKRIKIYNEIMSLYNKGYNRSQISKMLNQPTTTVYRYTKEGFDIESRKELPFKKVTKEVNDYIIKEYFDNAKTVKELCEELKLSRQTIEFYINKYKYANTEVR